MMLTDECVVGFGCFAGYWDVVVVCCGVLDLYRKSLGIDRTVEGEERRTLKEAQFLPAC